MTSPYLTKAAAGFLVGLAAGVLLTGCAPSGYSGGGGRGGGGHYHDDYTPPPRRTSTIMRPDGSMEICTRHGNGGIVTCM